MGQGNYTALGGQKPSNKNGAINASLTLSKHSGPSTSPTMASLNPGPHKKPGNGATQGIKSAASVPSSSVSTQLPQVCIKE